MKSNSEIRKESRSFLSGKWGSAVAVTIVYLLILYACSFAGMLLGALLGAIIFPDDFVAIQAFTQIFTLIPAILIGFPLFLSHPMLFLSSVRGDKELAVGNMFQAFKAPYYTKSMGLYLLITIFTYLWTLLLFVPGIIKSLSYQLAPFIIADNPTLSANEAIEQSMKMMKGHKMQLFLMNLGIVGLMLLSAVALFIPILWIQPYWQTILAKFYEEVKSEYNSANC